MAVLDDVFLRDLHRRMFGDVWSWAGQYRTRALSIGIEWIDVPTAVRDLMADSIYWFNGADTAAVAAGLARFHHRLVQIHPFPNGNGRVSRLVTDELRRSIEHPPLTWGADAARAGATTKQLRAAYLAGLRAIDVDPDDLQPLIEFMRS